jgi:hypothetical protein
MLGSSTQEQEIKRLIAEMQHNEWSLGVHHRHMDDFEGG